MGGSREWVKRIVLGYSKLWHNHTVVNEITSMEAKVPEKLEEEIPIIHYHHNSERGAYFEYSTSSSFSYLSQIVKQTSAGQHKSDYEGAATIHSLHSSETETYLIIFNNFLALMAASTIFARSTIQFQLLLLLPFQSHFSLGHLRESESSCKIQSLLPVSR